jgi:hypothetical protein
MKNGALRQLERRFLWTGFVMFIVLKNTLYQLARLCGNPKKSKVSIWQPIKMLAHEIAFFEVASNSSGSGGRNQFRLRD